MAVFVGILLVVGCGGNGSNPDSDTTPPGSPTDFTASVEGETVELEWVLPGDVDLFGVLVLRQAQEGPEGVPEDGVEYFPGEIIGPSTVIFRGLNTANAYIDTPPEPDRYCYRVFAFDTAFNYSGAPPRCVNTDGEDTEPPSFAGIATATGISNSQIQLTWTAATDDVTSSDDIVYEVYQGASEDTVDFSTPVHTTEAGVTSFTVFGLNPGVTYWFGVRARDLAGNRDSNSVTQSASTLEDPDTTPPVFDGLEEATAMGSYQIRLSWSAASDDITEADEIVYDVFQADISGGQTYGSPSHTTSAGATEFMVTGLSAESTYYFVVRARDLAGNSDSNEEEGSATTSEADLTPPYIVTDNFLSGGILPNGTTNFTASVTFSEPVSEVNGSHVTVDNGAVLSGFSTSDNITWSFTVTSLADGGRYRVDFTNGIQDLGGNNLSPTHRELYVANSVLYVRPGGSGSMTGASPADALPLVSQAIALASSTTDVFVEGGNYTDSITIKEGVSLFGGFDASFTVRDPWTGMSLLSQAAFEATVAVPAGVTHETLIDGMAFTNTLEGRRYAMEITDGGGLTVRNSQFFLPPAGCHTQTVIKAVYSSGTILVLERNIIDAGGTSSSACGYDLMGLTLTGEQTSLRLDGNTVTMGTFAPIASSMSYEAWTVYANGPEIEIVNNVIDAGGDANGNTLTTHGIAHNTYPEDHSLVIVNNTISGGYGIQRYAINLEGAIDAQNDVRIANNLISTHSDEADGIAIYRSSDTGKISHLENNLFASNGVFFKVGGDTSYTTLSSMETALSSAGTVALSNKEAAEISDLHLEDVASGDFRPTPSSPESLTLGGRDTSGADWGEVVTDRLGLTRQMPYSVGAYEAH